MAGIQKRVRASGTTTYVVRWYGPDGTERSKGGFRTRKDARAFATKAENETLAGTDFDPGKGKVLFRDAAAIWLESRKADTRNNAANHRYALAPAATRRGDGKTLGIDAVFGAYPLNKITREYIQEWVNELIDAGKQPSTVRHAFWTVRMVLEQAVVDGRLSKSPADYVKLPKETGAKGGEVGVVDRSECLNPKQVAALVDATPWPYNVMTHLAVWTGLRAAELGGLTIGAVELGKNPHVRVEQAARPNGPLVEYGPLKTQQSYRRVPLTAETAELLRAYLKSHARASEPTAPLFPGMSLAPAKPAGVRATTATGEIDDRGAKYVARRQATALAELSVRETEARLELDWGSPLRHPTFYKAVYRPAVLRATRAATARGDQAAALPADLKFHTLRHTYASLCINAGIKPIDISAMMGHRNVKTTLTVYAHLINTDDHASNMAALGAVATRSARPSYHGNVVPINSLAVGCQ